MDFLDEVESMAQNATSATTRDALPPQHEIGLWARLFNLTSAQVEGVIQAHYSNLSRLRISDEHWDLIRAEAEAQGHNRETYIYYLLGQSIQAPALQPTRAHHNKRRANTRMQYLFKLIPPLDSPAKIRNFAPDFDIPCTIFDDNMTTQFAIVDTETKATIQQHLATLHIQPTFVGPLRQPAEKDLSHISIAPCLGIRDPTMPQFRLSTPHDEPRPRQNEYPVHYFFYGTLAQPEKLVQVLGLDQEPVLKKAMVQGGRLRMWHQYKALTDGEEGDIVDGWAYEVETKKHEHLLMWYEQGKYEVARCDIEVADGKPMRGLTFRFCGDKKELK